MDLPTPHPPGFYPGTPAEEPATPTFGQSEGPLEAAGRKLQELSIDADQAQTLPKVSTHDEQASTNLDAATTQPTAGDLLKSRALEGQDESLNVPHTREELQRTASTQSADPLLSDDAALAAAFLAQSNKNNSEAAQLLSHRPEPASRAVTSDLGEPASNAAPPASSVSVSSTPATSIIEPATSINESIMRPHPTENASTRAVIGVPVTGAASETLGSPRKGSIDEAGRTDAQRIADGHHNLVPALSTEPGSGLYGTTSAAQIGYGGTTSTTGKASVAGAQGLTDDLSSRDRDEDHSRRNAAMAAGGLAAAGVGAGAYASRERGDEASPRSNEPEQHSRHLGGGSTHQHDLTSHHHQQTPHHYASGRDAALGSAGVGAVGDDAYAARDRETANTMQSDNSQTARNSYPHATMPTQGDEDDHSKRNAALGAAGLGGVGAGAYAARDREVAPQASTGESYYGQQQPSIGDATDQTSYPDAASRQDHSSQGVAIGATGPSAAGAGVNASRDRQPSLHDALASPQRDGDRQQYPQGGTPAQNRSTAEDLRSAPVPTRDDRPSEAVHGETIGDEMGGSGHSKEKFAGGAAVVGAGAAGAAYATRDRDQSLHDALATSPQNQSATPQQWSLDHPESVGGQATDSAPPRAREQGRSNAEEFARDDDGGLDRSTERGQALHGHHERPHRVGPRKADRETPSGTGVPEANALVKDRKPNDPGKHGMDAMNAHERPTTSLIAPERHRQEALDGQSNTPLATSVTNSAPDERARRGSHGRQPSYSEQKRDAIIGSYAGVRDPTAEQHRKRLSMDSSDNLSRSGSSPRGLKAFVNGPAPASEQRVDPTKLSHPLPSLTTSPPGSPSNRSSPRMSGASDRPRRVSLAEPEDGRGSGEHSRHASGEHSRKGSMSGEHPRKLQTGRLPPGAGHSSSPRHSVDEQRAPPSPTSARPPAVARPGEKRERRGSFSSIGKSSGGFLNKVFHRKDKSQS